MNLEEKTLSSELLFDGHVVHLYKDAVSLPNGAQAAREYIKHVGAVGVVALTDEGEVILERQYRYPFHTVMVEIPAGKLNSVDEDPLEAAVRELREETGAVAKEMIYLGEFYGSPAILGERLHLFLAKGLTFGACNPDEDEFLDVFRLPLDTLVEKILAGEIADGKTQAAVLRTAMMLNKEKSV